MEMKGRGKPHASYPGCRTSLSISFDDGSTPESALPIYPSIGAIFHRVKSETGPEWIGFLAFRQIYLNKAPLMTWQRLSEFLVHGQKDHWQEVPMFSGFF